MKKALAPLAIVGLLLTGCGGAQPDNQAPKPEPAAKSSQPAPKKKPAEISKNEAQKPWGHGTYKFAAQGTTGTIELPAAPPDDLAALGEELGAPESTFINVHIDNRQGVDSAGMYEVHVFTPAGKKYTFKSVGEVLDWEWPEADVNDTAAYNRSVDIYNKYLNGAAVGEVKDVPLIGIFGELPEKISRVAVYPFGAFDEFEAYPEAMFDELQNTPIDNVPSPDAGGLPEGSPKAEWLADVRAKYPELESSSDEELLLTVEMIGCLHFDMELPAADLKAEMEAQGSAATYMITTGIPIFCPKHAGKL